MKRSYEEITTEIMRRKDIYYKKQKRIKTVIFSVTPICLILCLIVLFNTSFAPAKDDFVSTFSQVRVEALFSGGYANEQIEDISDVSQLEKFITQLFEVGGHDNELTYAKDNASDTFVDVLDNVDYVLFFSNENNVTHYVVTRYYIIKSNKEVISINLDDYEEFRKMLYAMI